MMAKACKHDRYFTIYRYELIEHAGCMDKDGGMNYEASGTTFHFNNSIKFRCDICGHNWNGSIKQTPKYIKQAIMIILRIPNYTRKELKLKPKEADDGER